MRHLLPAILVALLTGWSTPAEAGRRRLRSAMDEATAHLRAGAPDEALAALSELEPTASSRKGREDVVRFRVLRGLARIAQQQSIPGLSDVQEAYAMGLCPVFLDAMAGIEAIEHPWVSWMELGCLAQADRRDELKQRLDRLSGEDPKHLALLAQHHRVVVFRSEADHAFRIGLEGPGGAGSETLYPWVVGADYLREAVLAVDDGLTRFPDAERLQQLRGELTEPSRTYREAPTNESPARADYPPKAEARGVEGVVAGRLLVDAAGAVRDVEVVRSEPPGLFDEAARTAWLQWQFLPHLEGKARRFVLEMDLRPR